MLNYTENYMRNRPTTSVPAQPAASQPSPVSTHLLIPIRKRVDSQNALWCPLVIYKANPRKPTIELPIRSVHDTFFIIYYFNGRYNLTFSYKS